MVISASPMAARLRIILEKDLPIVGDTFWNAIGAQVHFIDIHTFSTHGRTRKVPSPNWWGPRPRPGWRTEGEGGSRVKIGLCGFYGNIICIHLVRIVPCGNCRQLPLFSCISHFMSCGVAMRTQGRCHTEPWLLILQ